QWLKDCEVNATNSDTRTTSEILLFSVALNETISHQAFAKAVAEKWPIQNLPPLVGHLATNQNLRGYKLPLHPAIEKVLLAEGSKNPTVDTTDPLQTAALELLGLKLIWDP